MYGKGLKTKHQDPSLDQNEPQHDHSVSSSPDPGVPLMASGSKAFHQSVWCLPWVGLGLCFPLKTQGTRLENTTVDMWE